MTEYETDNRDPHTTDLVLKDGTRITVDPFELFRNMVENNYDLDKHEDMDLAELEEMVKFLRHYTQT